MTTLFICAIHPTRYSCVCMWHLRSLPFPPWYYSGDQSSLARLHPFIHSNHWQRQWLFWRLWEERIRGGGVIWGGWYCSNSLCWGLVWWSSEMGFRFDSRKCGYWQRVSKERLLYGSSTLTLFFSFALCNNPWVLLSNKQQLGLNDVENEFPVPLITLLIFVALHDRVPFFFLETNNSYV